jgi:transcriptional regulator with PAS, ATPase and Fis domain
MTVPAASLDYGQRRVTESCFIAAAPKMQTVLAAARRIAAGQMKVLITGESGVGKDLVARYIHGQSPRAQAPFVAVNCAGLSETLLESELFGHVRGSFTGAHRDKVGRLQMANRGTVFLDEVGEMSPRMQALLLRFLENGEIQQVGSDSMVTRTDVRVVAATNRDLGQMVVDRQFREDLLYRIKVAHVHVPPLRERREDIPALVEHVIGRSGRSYAVAPDAMEVLQRYPWPGNVRELQNVIEQIISVADHPRVSVDDLPRSLVADAFGTVSRARERRRQVADDLYQSLISGEYDFWNHVQTLFLNRDITRHDLRETVRRGLRTTEGSYRRLLALFHVNRTDYKRFLNFLAAHDCRVDFREFRSGDVAAAPHTARVSLRSVSPATAE